jgi:hypothetical protein
MKHLLSAMLIAALALATAQASEVYRTIDEHGVVVYSDRPLGPHSERVHVSARPVDQAQAAATALQAREPERRQDSGEGGLAAALEEQRALRTEACREARQAAEAYERAPRLYEELPDGGRRYLSDEEIVAARQAARQAVEDFCDD